LLLFLLNVISLAVGNLQVGTRQFQFDFVMGPIGFARRESV
jgi:hypothetical protein